MKVPLCRPQLDERELEAVREVLASGWLTQGPRVAALENWIRDYLGCSFAVATSSGSTALHLALLATGIGPGDEVILPSFTWVSSAAAVEQCGARPVFCDIDLATYNIDTRLIEPLITSQTRAIMPVSLFGLSADLSAIRDIAARHDLVVIEDAACALGASIDGEFVGNIGGLGCFSFHPRKSVTTGEGGLVIGHDRAYELLLRSQRSHGFADDPTHPDLGEPFFLPDVDKPGFNYRMSDLQAAIGLVQLGRLEDSIKRRREIASWYDAELAGLEPLALPAAPVGRRHTYQSYVLRLDMKQLESDQAITLEFRNRIMQNLKQAGIESRPGTMAVHRLRYFRERYGLTDRDLPNATSAEQHSLAIPLYPGLSRMQVEYVIARLHTSCREAQQVLAGASVVVPQDSGR